MAILIENMFYVRELPWHGQGINLDNPPTAEDAIVAAGLNWAVESREIYNAAGEVISGFKANTRYTDDSVLGIVSDKYKIVQNIEAFEFVDSLVGEGLTYETAGSLRGGKTIWLLAKMPQTKILGEELDPYICFTNTHDGSGAIRCICTPVRVVCNNTLNFALNSAKRSWATRHIGAIEGKLVEARETLGLAQIYIEHLQRDAERLADIKITDGQIENIIDFMYPVTADTSDKTKNNIIRIKEQYFECLDRDDVKQYRGTAYGAMMAATDHADHSQPLRITTSSQENRFANILMGHPFVDGMYRHLNKIAA